MHLLNSAIRITIGGRLHQAPTLFRFIESPDETLHLESADVTLAGSKLTWEAKPGLLFDARDRAGLAADPTLSVYLCGVVTTWSAHRHRRPDGMETVIVENGQTRFDLAEISFQDLLSAEQREAVELTAEAIGRKAPSSI